MGSEMNTSLSATSCITEIFLQCVRPEAAALDDRANRETVTVPIGPLASVAQRSFGAPDFMAYAS